MLNTSNIIVKKDGIVLPYVFFAHMDMNPELFLIHLTLHYRKDENQQELTSEMFIVKKIETNNSDVIIHI